MSDAAALLRASPRESARFGLSVARLTLTTEPLLEAAGILEAAEEYDVVILRYPAHHSELFAQLHGAGTRDLIYADTLQYWDWRPQQSRPTPPVDPGDLDMGCAEVARMVSEVFVGYPSHYAANPLFGPADTLAGYVEWAVGHLRAGTGRAIGVSGPDDSWAAFAVIDTTTKLPEILLAGVHPDHRGRGRYGQLMDVVMGVASASRWEGLTISTQSHNVTVMGAWSRRGWCPVQSLTTLHLVRHGLLSERPSQAQ